MISTHATLEKHFSLRDPLMNHNYSYPQVIKCEQSITRLVCKKLQQLIIEAYLRVVMTTESADASMRGLLQICILLIHSDNTCNKKLEFVIYRHILTCIEVL